MSDFWEQRQFSKITKQDIEAHVETAFLIPFLRSLGYSEIEDISAKPSVEIYDGRKKRHKRPDYVIYNGKERTKNNCLIVVEAKRPSERLLNAKEQGESYAKATGAPILLLTNGISIEIWQMQISFESEMIFTCLISELYNFEGKIKSLLEKLSVIEYCRSVYRKNIYDTVNDISEYIQIEINRISPRKPHVQRDIAHVTKEKRLEEKIDSRTLVDKIKTGAVITAISGFGKTALARSLFFQSLHNFKVGKTKAIPIEISLPDVANSGIDFKNYAYDRVKAHLKHMNYQSFESYISKNGAVLFCDSLERVASIHIDKLVSDINVFNRDYKNVKLFIFSRPNYHSMIQLPQLAICELTRNQQNNLAEIITGVKGYRIRENLAGNLIDRLGHPIFLELICKYYTSTNRKPQNLISLFDNWLSRALEWADPSPSIRARRSDALTIIANITIAGAISQVEVLEALAKANHSDAIFDALVQSSAINIQGDTVELEHEALADFLRAKTISKLDNENFHLFIKELKFDESSLLPSLLLCLAENLTRQDILFGKFLHSGIKLYLSSFRYKNDNSNIMLTLDVTERKKKILLDILNSFIKPIKIFTPALERVILNRFGCKSNEKIGIFGEVDDEFSQICYSFLPVDKEADSVRLTIPENASLISSQGLSGADSGRLIGTNLFFSELSLLNDKRSLIGSINFARERLASRIYYLFIYYGFNKSYLDLNFLKNEFAKYADCILIFGKKEFPAKELISDVEICLEYGDTIIEVWWEKYMKGDQFIIETNNLNNLIIEIYTRATNIYDEIITNSFYKIKDYMNMHLTLPVKWQFDIDIKENNILVEAIYMPTSAPKKTDTAFEFQSLRPDKRSFFDEHFNDVISQLKNLRNNTSPTVWSESFMLMPPEFQGSDASHKGESLALREAIKWLKYDIKTLGKHISDT